MASGPDGCPAAPVSNPFAPWGDNADYELAPAGDAEGALASWTLSGGAAGVEGNETFVVTSPSDHRSIALPATSTAMTARSCVSADHPTFRFFAKRTGGSAWGRLLVEVVYDDANGRPAAIAAGQISGSSTWAPSPSLSTLVSTLAPGDSTIDVSFRFTPQSGTTWAIDDVYVDPIRGIR